MNRRSFLVTTSAVTTGLVSINKFSEAAITKEKIIHAELLRAAILASSSHNTQPWKFHAEEKIISIRPDFSRKCEVVDPDNHHLFVSLGCATENLIQTAITDGLMAETSLEHNKEIQVHLTPTRAKKSLLFDAIPKRQCSRVEYSGLQLSQKELNLLNKAGSGSGVQCQILTEKSALEKILEFVVQGNSAQMNDPAFVAELKSWIRFNKHQALMTGDGLYSGTNGSPSIPTWLGKIVFGSLFNSKNENEKYTKQIRSSAGIAVFTSEKNDIKHWIEVGRCYERFALQATVLDVRTAMINQPVEVQSIRPVFASYLGLGNQRPDLVVRFGKGPLAPRSMRRPLHGVLF